MAYVIACLMAAVSFLLNRKLLEYVGAKAIISYGPVAEEAAKTLLAFYLGADIILTHVTFGVIEAVYDGYHSRRPVMAALLSVVGHGLFGVVTLALLRLSGSIWLSLAAAVLAHLTWNVTVIRVMSY